jgi:two-component system LytT family response regulator
MNTIIIEDELLAAKNLISILNQIGDIQVLAQLESIAESVEWFDSHPHPDVVFMDIHLADGSSFEIFERTSIKCPVIFTTAYDEYALKAFKVNSIDYLLKPIDIQDVRQALAKFQSMKPSNMTDELHKLLDSFKEQASYKTNLLVPTKGDKLIPLPVDEIAFIYIESGVTKAITYSEKVFFLESNLDEIMKQLNPTEFFRANRQFIISRHAVKDMDLWFNSRLSVNLKVPVPEKILISKARNTEFKHWLTTH